MASESNTTTTTSSTERRAFSVSIPVVLSFTVSNPGSTQERIIVINPITQTMTVIEGSGGLDSDLDTDLDTLFRNAQEKGGHPPAAKSAVEALPRVEITEEGGGESGNCVICMEEYGVGSVVTTMPCKHGFHDTCLDKWLGVHGNCPVCRYQLPVDDHVDGKMSEEAQSGDGDGDDGRGVWVRFSVGVLRRPGGGGDSGDDGSRAEGEMTDID